MEIIFILQLCISIVLIVLILLQEPSSGLSGLFGGGSDGGFYQKRRGAAKLMFWATLALVFIYVALAIINLLA